MDKSCANHPESMALATCKACDKSICLMCVVDEKEGTFCSSECHSAFVEGREVPKFEDAGAAAEPAQVASSGAQKIESIFDDGPSAPASSGLNLPPSEDAMPIVAEGTKWRSIGTQCDNHTDTPAVANCDRCGKPVCALCLLEASQGTFCSSDCLNATSGQPAPLPEAPAAKGRTSAPAPAPVSGAAERAALQGKPVFNFKTPKRTNKAGLIAVIAVFAVIIPVGAYYSWKVFAPQHLPTVTPPPVVKQPDPVLTPKPPVVKTPDPVVTKKPPVVKTPDPVVVKTPEPDPGPTMILRPKPVPKIQPTRVLNPWAEEPKGTWYRLKTTSGGKTVYTDIGLKEKNGSSYVLATATSTGQSSEKKVDAPTVYLRGESTLTVSGQSFLCEATSPTLDKDSPKTLTLISSKYPGATFKTEGADGFTASKVWEYTMRVKNRSFDCLVVEGLAGKQSLKTYYAALPLQMVRQEKDGESTVLVDFGDDWSKRPAFPN